MLKRVRWKLGLGQLAEAGAARGAGAPIGSATALGERSAVHGTPPVHEHILGVVSPLTHTSIETAPPI